MASTDQPTRPERPTLIKRSLPNWMVYTICFASVMLLLASLLELPSSFDSGKGTAALAIGRVIIWAGMTTVYVPDSLARFREKR